MGYAMNRKAYIGDGVYVEDNGVELILTTENGISVQNRIVLEPDVLFALERFIKEKQNNVK